MLMINSLAQSFPISLCGEVYIMKTGKTIVSVLVMAVVLSCSLFPVFATGTVVKTTSASFQGPNTNYFASVRATQYQGVGTAGNGTSTSAYVGESAIVVTVSFFNDGDEPWFLDGVYVRLNDSSAATHQLTDLDILGGNLSVSQTGTPYNFSIFGGENNSYNNGFVVAPHSNLSVAFRVSAFATSDSSNPQFSLNTVSFGAGTNSVGDYPYGIDVDFSPLIDFLNSDVVPEMLDQGLTLDNIFSLLQSDYPDINSFINNNPHGGFSHYYNFGLPFSGGIRVNSYPGYPIALDFEVDSLSDQAGEHVIYCVPVLFTYDLVNSTDKTYSITRYINAAISYSIPSGYAFVGYRYENLNYDQVQLYNRSLGALNYRLNSNDGYVQSNGNALISSGNSCQSYDVLYIYLSVGSYTSSYQATSCPAIDLTLTLQSSYSYSVYTDQTLFSSFSKNFADLRDRLDSLIDLLTGDTSTNDTVSQESQAAESTADTIHAQEEQWYSQNEAAIQSSGLSNYQFSTNQLSGIGTISSQFSSVWNALGDWTLVYVFVLLLSLATFIIRHRPSTKMQQRVATMEREQFINKSVRAQRDSLYRHYWERYHK